MGQFSKSKKVLHKAWEKFKDSFRWNTGNLRVYEFHPGMSTAIHKKKCEMGIDIVDYSLEFSQLQIKQDDLQDTEVKEEFIELEPVITAETPPDQIEAEIHEESLDNINADISDHSMANMHTEAKGLRTCFEKAAEAKGLPVRAPGTRVRKLEFRKLDAIVSMGDQILAQIPITRNSMSIFAMSAPSRMAYWKEIIEQTGKKPAQLDLLGIFAHVPVKGITKASIDQTTGVLRLWYSPDQKKNRSATLLIAKERETKQLVRVFDRRTLS